MINTESWFYKEGRHIGTLEANNLGSEWEAKTRRADVAHRIIDTPTISRVAVMIDYRAGIKQAWKDITGSTRGAFNND